MRIGRNAREMLAGRRFGEWNEECLTEDDVEFDKWGYPRVDDLGTCPFCPHGLIGVVWNPFGDTPWWLINASRCHPELWDPGGPHCDYWAVPRIGLLVLPDHWVLRHAPWLLLVPGGEVHHRRTTA